MPQTPKRQQRQHQIQSSLFAEAAPVIASPAPHPAPLEEEDPERPTSIEPSTWKLMRRRAHLIAVDEKQLRAMHTKAPNDPPVARKLSRVGSEIDALRVQILALADEAGQQKEETP